MPSPNPKNYSSFRKLSNPEDKEEEDWYSDISEAGRKETKAIVNISPSKDP